jgi:hypothetical protein
LKQARAINSIASRLPPSSDRICALKEVRKTFIGVKPRYKKFVHARHNILVIKGTAHPQRFIPLESAGLEGS